VAGDGGPKWLSVGWRVGAEISTASHVTIQVSRSEAKHRSIHRSYRRWPVRGPGPSTAKIRGHATHSGLSLARRYESMV
jgi:hypothetical protein